MRFETSNFRSLVSRPFLSSSGFLCAILLLSPQMASAQNSLLPTGRTPAVLQPNARNPFGQAVTAQEPATIEATETEETRLRRIIGFIKVGGVSGTPDKLRVLLGSLILKSGDTMPPLIEEQKERLQVKGITKDAVELSFVETDPSIDPRLVRIPIMTPPRVAHMFYGEAVENLVSIAPKPAQKALASVPLKGVQDFIEDSKAIDLRNVTDRKVEMMGVVKDAEQSIPDK